MAHCYINDLKVGDKIQSPENGTGIIRKIEGLSITVIFLNGKLITCTYKSYLQEVSYSDF